MAIRHFGFLILLISIWGSVAAENSPVLIWGPASHYTQVTALKSYSPDEFTDILTSYIKDDTFGVVITEPTLTAEDISLCRTSKGATCFQDIQKIPNKLYMPSVENPVDILQELGETSQPDIHFTANGVLNETIVPEGGKFIFIHLEDALPGESKTEILSRHDQLIAQLTKELSAKNKNIVIIYTGATPASKDLERHVREAAAQINETIEHDVSQRANTGPRADETEAKGKVLQKDGMLIYYEEMYEIDEKDAKHEIVIDDLTVTEKDGVLHAELTGSKTVSFNLTIGGGYWNVDKFVLNGKDTYAQKDIGALVGFSFHCTPIIVFKAIVHKDGKDLYSPIFYIRGLQIEGRLESNSNPLTQFSDPWDCVGFTSPGLLGGLFVTIMLLLILTIGLSWIMDIRTMDRFDDPKGKTITISVTE